MPRAFPMSSFTACGNSRKSRLDDPTQCSGFSSAARTRRTVDYPSSGIIDQPTSTLKRNKPHCRRGKWSRRCSSRSGMNLLFPLQPSNKLLNLPSASLRFSHRLNSPKDSIPIRPVKSLEKCFSPRIRVQRSLKVARHRGSAGRIIGGIPSSILFGILDRLQPRGFHLPVHNQRQRFLPVDLRPDALARTRKKSLQPGLFAFRPLLPVNPSVAQRNLERFLV